MEDRTSVRLQYAAIALLFVAGAFLGLRAACRPTPATPRELSAERLAELKGIMQQGDEAARLGAVHELSEWGVEAVLDPLVAALNDESGRVARAAQDGLKAAGLPAVPRLIACLRSEFKDVRDLSLEALLAITGQYFGSDPAAWQAWYDKGPPAEAPAPDAGEIDLVSRFVNAGPEDKAALAPQLAAARTDAAFLALTEALDDSNRDVRQDVIRTLADTGDPRAVAPLVAQFRKCEPPMMESLTRALFKLGMAGVAGLAPVMAEEGYPQAYSSQAIRDWLSADFGDDYPNRRRTWTAMSDQGVEAIIPLLLNELDGVRAYAARILGRTGNLKAVLPLMELLDKNYPKPTSQSGAFIGIFSHFEAIRALGNLDAKPADGRLFTIWRACENKYAGKDVKNSCNDLVMLAAAFARARISNDYQSREYLVNVLRLGRTQSGGRGPSEWAAYLCVEMDATIEPLLIEVLDEKDDDARALAAWALGVRQSIGGVRPLAAHLEDADDDVIAAAAKALGRIRDPESVPALTAALNRAERWPVAVEIIGGLRLIGDARAVPALIEILKHENTDVRYAAKRALEKLTGQDLGYGYEAWKKWYSRTAVSE